MRVIVTRWPMMIRASWNYLYCPFNSQAAFDLTVDHRLPIWDAVILAVAAESCCRLLLSEDFQNGFVWRGVTVVDPLASPASTLLVDLLL
jgi:hypothetical protein